MHSRRRSHLLDAGFSLPERMAMVLDGEVYPVDEEHAHLDEPETSALRAAALERQGLHPRLIAERWTASWLWLALPRAPRVHTFCVSMAARVQHHRPRNRVIREVIIDDDESTMIGGVRVTTLARTIVDLARLDPSATAEHDADQERRLLWALHMMLRTTGELPGSVVARLPRTTTHAVRRLATERLVAAAQLEVTR